jgi:hypothetical protein
MDFDLKALQILLTDWEVSASSFSGVKTQPFRSEDSDGHRTHFLEPALIFLRYLLVQHIVESVHNSLFLFPCQ